MLALCCTPFGHRFLGLPVSCFSVHFDVASSVEFRRPSRQVTGHRFPQEIRVDVFPKYSPLPAELPFECNSSPLIQSHALAKEEKVQKSGVSLSQLLVIHSDRYLPRQLCYPSMPAHLNPVSRAFDPQMHKKRNRVRKRKERRKWKEMEGNGAI